MHEQQLQRICHVGNTGLFVRPNQLSLYHLVCQDRFLGCTATGRLSRSLRAHSLRGHHVLVRFLGPLAFCVWTSEDSVGLTRVTGQRWSVEKKLTAGW